MEEKKENIDCVEYWFSEYRKRSPDEIKSIEEKIKYDLLEKAKNFLFSNPNEQKTAEKLASEWWEKDYNKFAWQKELRHLEYHDSNISLLCKDIINELLGSSTLLYKSANEKDEIRNNCYIAFFERLKDYTQETIDGLPSVSIPYSDTSAMQKFVKNILLEIEPRLVAIESPEDLKLNLNMATGNITLDNYFQLMPDFIKSHIRSRISENLLLKRTFVTIDELDAFINKCASRILKGIQTEVIERIEFANDKLFIDFFSEEELKNLINEFLFAMDNRFEIIDSDKKSNSKKRIKHGDINKICAAIYNELLINGQVDLKTTEKKSDRGITQKIIPVLEEKYFVPDEQKETIHTYFRKRIIEARKTKDGVRVIINKF